MARLRYPSIPGLALLADKIEVRHVPAMQGDPEIIDKQQFGSDLPALKRALKDFHMDVVSTALEANAFTGLDEIGRASCRERV